MTRVTVAIGFGVLVLVGCDGRITTSEPPLPTTDAALRESIARWGVVPIGPMPAQNPAMVTLGRALFFDKILSGNRDIACATCHQPDAGLGDGLSLAIGTGGTGLGPSRTLGSGRTFIPRNAPTLLNAGLGLFYEFWDGRLSGQSPGPFFSQPDTLVFSNAQTILAAQAMLPVLNRAEMRGERGDLDVFGNANELAAIEDGQRARVWQGIMARLLAIPGYVDLFAAAFPARSPSALSFNNAAEAIAAFQMESFTKTNSPFDRYLGRDDAALTTQQKRGAMLFFNDARCGSCHNGPFLGGQDFANVGAPQVGPGVGQELPLDLGRAAFNDFEFYRFAFRVAPLRNVELTAPYMHSGAYRTLDAVVHHYNDIPTAIQTYDVTQLEPTLRGMYHGDEAMVTMVQSTLDGRINGGLDLTESQLEDLVAFLEALTDPSARDLSAIIPASVPSGLPVHE
jgi:cytochrome c peroxidase